MCECHVTYTYTCTHYAAVCACTYVHVVSLSSCHVTMLNSLVGCNVLCYDVWVFTITHNQITTVFGDMLREVGRANGVVCACTVTAH